MVLHNRHNNFSALVTLVKGTKDNGEKSKNKETDSSHHVLATKIKGLRKSDNKIQKLKTKAKTIR